MIRQGDTSKMRQYADHLRTEVNYCRYEKCLQIFHSHAFCQNTGAFYIWKKESAEDFKKRVDCSNF